MAKLIVTLADNSVTEIEITPRLEYAFELYAKKGFHKAFRDDEKQSDALMQKLSRKCLLRTGNEEL